MGNTASIRHPEHSQTVPLQRKDTRPTQDERGQSQKQVQSDDVAEADSDDDLTPIVINSASAEDYSYKRKCGLKVHERYPWYGKPRLWAPCRERDQRFRNAESKHKEKETPPYDGEIKRAALQERPHVNKVNFHIAKNTKHHHTNLFQCTAAQRCHPSRRKPELVIRRGSEFFMTLEFSSSYDVQKQDIRLAFSLGDDWRPLNNLSVQMKVVFGGRKSYLPTSWGASFVSQDGNCVTLSVFVPPSAPVGEWTLCVLTNPYLRRDDVVWQYIHNQEILILFNPWCKEDLVYLEDDSWRREAVLNDSGVYYHGSQNKMAASPWFYGQFEDGILEAALHIMRRGFGYEITIAMANPAFVTRALAKAICQIDGSGVLMGSWNMDHYDGTAPTKWNGSVTILRQYMSSASSVKYGNCWVFAGILTTLCRALGIPCRSVTNYSNHDAIDKSNLDMNFFNVRHLFDDWVEISKDLIWCFHVWNEIWTKRPGLKDPLQIYDGWQVIDVMFRETNSGIFNNGVCPVRAVKEGDLTVDFNAANVYVAVNADRVSWQHDSTGNALVEKKREPNIAGLCLITHEPTGRPYRGASMRSYGGKQRLERLDLTETYKYPKDSKRLQTVRKNVRRYLTKTFDGSFNEHRYNQNSAIDDYPAHAHDDIHVLIHDPGDVFVGKGFSFRVDVENSGRNGRNVRAVVLKVFYQTYYGIVTEQAAVRKFKEFHLKAGKIETFDIDVTPKLSRARPEDGFYFYVQAMVEVEDTNIIFNQHQNFLLRRPNIKLNGPPSCQLKKDVEVTLAFTNPLPVSLTNCYVHFEGGFTCTDGTKSDFKIKDIPPNETWTHTLCLQPTLYPGEKAVRDLCVGLESSQLRDINGYLAIQVHY